MVQTLDGAFADRASFNHRDRRWVPRRPTIGTHHRANRTSLRYELFEADATELDVTDNPSMNGRCSSWTPGQRTLGQTVADTTADGWFTLCQINNVPRTAWPVRAHCQVQCHPGAD